jgi:hypothetical protein
MYRSFFLSLVLGSDSDPESIKKVSPNRYKKMQIQTNLADFVIVDSMYFSGSLSSKSSADPCH